MTPFVGASRISLVAGLVDVFEEICSSGESRWVSLEAPPGWGKTRVGREFYAEIAARQTSPRYWPERINNPHRKAIVPTGDREANSLPQFLWWGVSCSERNGVAAEALRYDITQLEEHARFVHIECHRRKGIGEKALRELIEKGPELVTEALSEAASLLIPLPGLGLALLLHKWSASKKSERLAELRLVGDRSALGGGSSEFASQLVDQLCALGEEQFPMVMFVEDVHLADDTLLEVMESTMRRSSHLMILTTTWPGLFDDDSALASVFEELDDQVLRITHHKPAGHPFPSEAGLLRLNSHDCTQIVQHYFPRVDSEAVKLLVSRFQNPQKLELICSLPKFQTNFGQFGDLVLTSNEISNLPDEIENLHKVHWEQLPIAWQLQYAVAAAISPESINYDIGHNFDIWSESVLLEVIGDLELPATVDLVSVGEAERDKYGWVIRADDDTRRWAETDQRSIATIDGMLLLRQHLSDARSDILRSLARIVLERDHSDLYSAYSAIALHVEGYVEDPAPIAAAIAVVLEHFGHDESLVAVRRQLYDLYLDTYEEGQSQVNDEADILARLNGVSAISQSLQHDIAAEQYHEISVRSLSIFGPDDPMTLAARNNFALEKQYMGEHEEAVTLFTQLVADHTRVLGANHFGTFSCRNNLGMALRTVGELEECKRLFEELVEDQTLTLGEDHVSTLSARNNLAVVYRDMGNFDLAIEVIEKVIGVRVSVLGEEHPDTLTSLNNLARTLRNVSRFSESEYITRKVVEARIRVLGENHPDTLKARNDHAGALAYLGRYPEAIQSFEKVIADRIRLLGDGHPETLRSLGDFAFVLRGVGRDDDAIPIMETVVAGRTRVLGDDHADTVASVEFLEELLLEENGDAHK